MIGGVARPERARATVDPVAHRPASSLRLTRFDEPPTTNATRCRLSAICQQFVRELGETGRYQTSPDDTIDPRKSSLSRRNGQQRTPADSNGHSPFRSSSPPSDTGCSRKSSSEAVDKVRRAPSDPSADNRACSGMIERCRRCCSEPEVSPTRCPSKPSQVASVRRSTRPSAPPGVLLATLSAATVILVGVAAPFLALC
jgi:hypothetical protein